jgi:hypothetical protein
VRDACWGEVAGVGERRLRHERDRGIHRAAAVPLLLPLLKLWAVRVGCSGRYSVDDQVTEVIQNKQRWLTSSTAPSGADSAAVSSNVFCAGGTAA